MCPFIIERTENQAPATKFLALTTACFYKDFISDVIAYAKKFIEQNQRVLLFDGSLGLGDLNIHLSYRKDQDVEAVLKGQKAISVLTERHEEMDWISGCSKKMNLGCYSEVQLYNLLSDLKLLGQSYQNVFIYVPPTLPNIQNFFCQQMDSVCFACDIDNSIAATMKLVSMYPNMRCYLKVREDFLKATDALRLTLALQKDRILYNVKK
ncbi:MAG: hypothetical protein J6Y85_02515 [Alphaproteobacteria bacterium]|nr:hypothetical protein [Alphaproteobacteria bacterium]